MAAPGAAGRAGWGRASRRDAESPPASAVGGSRVVPAGTSGRRAGPRSRRFRWRRGVVAAWRGDGAARARAGPHLGGPRRVGAQAAAPGTAAALGRLGRDTRLVRVGGTSGREQRVGVSTTDRQSGWGRVRVAGVVRIADRGAGLVRAGPQRLAWSAASPCLPGGSRRLPGWRRGSVRQALIDGRAVLAGSHRDSAAAGRRVSAGTKG